MHISNKYSPFIRGRRVWDCWKIVPSKRESKIAKAWLNYSNYGFKSYIEDAEKLAVSRCVFETNQNAFGATQKHSGAWKSGPRLSRAKKFCNHRHRQMERYLIHRYLEECDYENHIENFKISDGYWD